MIRELHSLSERHKDSSRLSICCTKVARFANVFEPYFDVMGIFVQAKPEYMALIWGSIKFFFQVCMLLTHKCAITLLRPWQLATNHVTFLEKVAAMFEKLSMSVPQFQELYDSCAARKYQGDSSRRLVKLLSLVYEDIVAFCGEIILILHPRRQGKRNDQYLGVDS